MAEIKEIIRLLKENVIPYSEISSFSKLPGIYAIFFIGNKFPLLGEEVKKHQLIYIGKTESSQEKRDAKTHFADGKTGSSTVRKSIGSLLSTETELKPIPRNSTDFEKRRFSHFKFDEESEEKITVWMKSNLGLSFYEFDEKKENISLDELETKIIKELVPVLNIDYKNPDNRYKSQILGIRAGQAAIASKQYKSMKLEEGNKNIHQKNEIDLLNTDKSSFDSRSLARTGTIIINNITNSDVSKRQIRILAEDKRIFPQEKRGMTMKYDLKFIVGGNEFIAEYKIGSKDGKSRSGILKLGDDIYNYILRIREGTKLRISKINEQNYSINKNTPE